MSRVETKETEDRKLKLRDILQLVPAILPVLGLSRIQAFKAIAPIFKTRPKEARAAIKILSTYPREHLRLLDKIIVEPLNPKDKVAGQYIFGPPYGTLIKLHPPTKNLRLEYIPKTVPSTFSHELGHHSTTADLAKLLHGQSTYPTEISPELQKQLLHHLRLLPDASAEILSEIYADILLRKAGVPYLPVFKELNYSTVADAIDRYLRYLPKPPSYFDMPDLIKREFGL